MQKHFYSKVEKVQFLVLVNYQIALKIELNLERLVRIFQRRSRVEGNSINFHFTPDVRQYECSNTVRFLKSIVFFLDIPCAVANLLESSRN